MSTVPKSAPPPIHAQCFLVAVLVIIFKNLPSLDSLDEVATTQTFLNSSINSLPSHVLGSFRLFFAAVIVGVMIWQINFDVVEEPTFYISGSRLKVTNLCHKGLRSQFFFTKWSWNLLGLSFFLSGLVSILPPSYHHRFLLRTALITFITAAPSALLVSMVVTYGLWPQLLKEKGTTATLRFQTYYCILQHNLNSFMVLTEVAFLGKIPVLWSHAFFPPLFGLSYILFSWFMAKRWKRRSDKDKDELITVDGPQYIYFFLDTTLPGLQPTINLLALLLILLVFYALLSFSEQVFSFQAFGADNDAINFGWRTSCFCLMNYLICRFKD